MGPAQALASGHHLLALPTGVTPAAVTGLAQSRWPQAGISATGDLVLNRYSSLTGPLSLSTPAAQQLGFWLTPDVENDLTQVYLVNTLVERGDPPWPGSLDPTGIARAFPDALPIREEERVVEWLVAAARYLGGAVRFDPSGIVVKPLPDAAIDLTIFSDRWVAPTDFKRLLQAIHPAFDVAGSEVEWTGPPTWVGPVGSHGALMPDGLTLAVAGPQADQITAQSGGLVLSGGDSPGSHLGRQRRAAIHAAADKVDIAALAQSPGGDTYTARADFGPGGQIWVEVGPAEVMPTALGTLASQPSNPVAYALRWVPLNPEDLLTEFPEPDHCRIRRSAAALLEQLARVIAQTVDGQVLNQDGFRTELPVSAQF